jgi:hypothetical protein
LTCYTRRKTGSDQLGNLRYARIPGITARELDPTLPVGGVVVEQL